MNRLCEGRVAIVTGAGRGIGREYALMLARHGAKVVVNDLGGARDGSGSDESPAEHVVAEIVADGGEAVANAENVADFAGAERMIRQAVDTFGDLHAVINNAGILRDRMLANMDEAEWDAVINVHLKGTFAPARHAAAYWRERSKAGEEDKEAMSPRWIAPIVTWLASEESAAVSGRVFEASGRVLAVAEGWVRGPEVEPTDDPTGMGVLVESMLATARANSGMNGDPGGPPQSPTAPNSKGGQ